MADLPWILQLFFGVGFILMNLMSHLEGRLDEKLERIEAEVRKLGWKQISDKVWYRILAVSKHTVLATSSAYEVDTFAETGHQRSTERADTTDAARDQLPREVHSGRHNDCNSLTR